MVHITEKKPESGNPLVILFDFLGNEKWRRSIPEYASNGVAISPDGMHVIAFGMTNTNSEYNFRTHLFDRNGNEINSFQEGADCYFSWNGKYAILSDKINVLYIDLQSGNIKWKKKMDRYPVNCFVSDDGESIAVLSADLAGYECIEPELIIYNKDGIIKINEKFNTDTCRIAFGDTKRLWGSSNGKDYQIRFKDAIRHLRDEN